VATAGDVIAPSQIEQSADVGGGRSQLVHLSTFWIAAMKVAAFMVAAAVSSGGS
jgi:hypothetical protein